MFIKDEYLVMIGRARSEIIGRIHPFLLFFHTSTTRSSVIKEGPRNMLVSIEKSLQSMNDLALHPRSSQLLLLNGISLHVCGLLFQRLYLGPFSRHYHF